MLLVLLVVEGLKLEILTQPVGYILVHLNCIMDFGSLEKKIMTTKLNTNEFLMLSLKNTICIMEYMVCLQE